MRQISLMVRRVILLGALLLMPAAAHEVRPGYIETVSYTHLRAHESGA